MGSFPTSLCGVLGFDSVSRRLCRRILLLLHHTSHTIFHTQLCHLPSFTHNFVTHTHNFVTYHLSHTNLSPIIFHTQLCHTHTQLCHTPSFTHNFVTHLGWLWWRAWTGLVAGDAAALCVAGVALGDIHLRFTWQA